MIETRNTGKGMMASGERRRKGLRALAVPLCPIILAIVITLTFLCDRGECENEKVRAHVDKTEATLEDQILLTISVTGSKRHTGTPQLPPIRDFTVTVGGTSSRTEIVNGRVNSSLDFTYLLTPRRVGNFTIGPVRLKHKGRIYESKPIQVKILAADTSPGEDRLAYITQEVDVESPFVHQQIVYTFRFYQKAQTLEAHWEPPSFDGFWTEEMGKERQYQKVLGGTRYSVTEIRRALFPNSPGPLEIGGTSLNCKLVLQTSRSRTHRSLDDFFMNPFVGARGQTVNKTLRADPILLTTRPLPEHGRPESFQGLVGSFDIQGKVGETKLRTGDSTTLTVTINGMGNLRDLVDLPPETINGFKIYPDKPTFQLSIQDNKIVSQKVFKKALVPLKEGGLEVPPLELVYFDPKKTRYRVARTEPIAITVEKGEETETVQLLQSSPLAGIKTSVQVLGKDILPIHTGDMGLSVHLPSGKHLVPLLGSLLLPPFGYFACFAVRKRRERLEGGPHIIRRREARKKAYQGLRKARRLVSRADDKEFFRQLSRSIKGLIGDKLNLSALAFTPVEVRRCLEKQGMNEEAVEDISRFLEGLEYCQYVSSTGETTAKEAQYHEAVKLTALLDKKL